MKIIKWMIKCMKSNLYDHYQIYKVIFIFKIITWQKCPSWIYLWLNCLGQNILWLQMCTADVSDTLKKKVWKQDRNNRHPGANSHADIVINKLHDSKNICIMVRVFANGPGDLGSIPGQVKTKTQKWYLMLPCLTLSIIR